MSLFVAYNVLFNVLVSVGCWLLIVGNARSSLCVGWCVLLLARRLLAVVWCVVCIVAACCLLLAARCFPNAVCSPLLAVCCLLCVALCLLFLACCLLYVVNRAFVVSVFRLTISIAIQNGSSFVLYVVCCLMLVV